MPVLKSRVPGFDLDRRVLRHLLVEAVRTRDPEAGADLHRLTTAKPELPAPVHEHLEHLADQLHGALAASADIAGVDRLRRPDKARIPGGAQGLSATAG